MKQSRDRRVQNIYRRYDQEKITYLQEALQRSTHPTHVHGACLGLGFAGMSAGTDAHMDLLQETLCVIVFGSRFSICSAVLESKYSLGTPSYIRILR